MHAIATLVANDCYEFDFIAANEDGTLLMTPSRGGMQLVVWSADVTAPSRMTYNSDNRVWHACFARHAGVDTILLVAENTSAVTQLHLDGSLCRVLKFDVAMDPRRIAYTGGTIGLVSTGYAGMYLMNCATGTCTSVEAVAMHPRCIRASVNGTCFIIGAFFHGLHKIDVVTGEVAERVATSEHFNNRFPFNVLECGSGQVFVSGVRHVTELHQFPARRHYALPGNSRAVACLAYSSA
jgi:hypothetical protein